MSRNNGLALVLVVAGCAAAQAQAQEQELKLWRHGLIEPKGDAGFSMMVGRNGFAARQGLKVEIVPFKNGATAHKALLAGEIDSIESSPGAALLAGARGADIKILGCDWPGVPHGLIARASIARVEDLKGKTVAVAAPGSMPNLLINAILNKHGVAPSEVRFANLGGDLERYKAVLAGVADAAIVAVEFMAVAPADIKMLVVGREVMPNYVRVCLTTTGKTLSERRADAVGFLAAEMEALRFAVSHREDTIKLTHEIIKDTVDDPRPAYAFDDSVKNGEIDPAVGLAFDKLNWMQGELVKAGNLKAPIDLAKITDASIRAEAERRVGK